MNLSLSTGVFPESLKIAKVLPVFKDMFQHFLVTTGQYQFFVPQTATISWYRKIPKISPGAYIFQRLFLRGLFLEGLIFGGAYLRREICVSKSIGLAYSWKEIYRFCFGLLCTWGQFPSTSPPGGLYSEGQCNGGFFALRVWGLKGELILGILRYSAHWFVVDQTLSWG